MSQEMHGRPPMSQELHGRQRRRWQRILTVELAIIRATRVTERITTDSVTLEWPTLRHVHHVLTSKVINRIHQVVIVITTTTAANTFLLMVNVRPTG